MVGEIHTVAHGKLLWLGGYSVLERPNIGYVTTIDAGVHAHLKKNGTDSIQIDVPQFGRRANGTVDLKTGDVIADAPKELDLLKTVIRISLMYAIAKGYSVSGFDIRTKNDESFSYRLGTGASKLSKSGLGSSAAVTVAAAGAIFRAFGIDAYENDALHKVAQISHATATGKIGSGFDVAAATYGDIVYTRYSPAFVDWMPHDFNGYDIVEAVEKRWDYSISRLPLPDVFGFSMANFVGDAAITTSMVGSVKEFKKTNEREYLELVNGIDKENRKAVKLLKKINEEGVEPEVLEAFRESFNRGRMMSKMLGNKSGVPIEPDDITKLIEESVKNGAFVAKSPGAGGYDSIAALFQNSEDRGRVLKFWESSDRLQSIEVSSYGHGFELGNKEKLRG